jgi:site-specific recombinase XerD
MELSHAVELFLQTVAMRSSKHTIYDYRNTLHQWQAFLGGDPPLESVTADDIRRFLYHMRVELERASKTVRNAHTGISSFYTWAEVELGVIHLIRGRITAPKASSRAIVPLTKADAKGLMDACDRTAVWQSTTRAPATASRPTRLRDRAIIVLLLDTGIRAQELCDLLVGDVDIKTGAIQVRHGKGDKGRTVYLGLRGRDALARYAAKRGKVTAGDSLFETNRRKPMDRDALRRMFESAGQRAEIAEPVTPHRMRHSFAVTYLRNGGDVFTLQRLLGHSTMDMVKRYLSLASVDMEKAHRKASPADNWRLG